MVTVYYEMGKLASIIWKKQLFFGKERRNPSQWGKKMGSPGWALRKL